jgi:lysophospholipase L1-like esterase
MKRTWIFPRIFLALLALVITLTSELCLQPSGSVRAQVQHRNIAPKQYLALGDSLAFGYQPNKDFIHGYTDLLAQRLQKEGVFTYANMACPGETSTTFTEECPQSNLRKYPYQGSQLQAAVHYIKQYPDQVSLVTLTIGANDVLRFISPTTCQVDEAGFKSALTVLDANLKEIILPRLEEALKVKGKMTDHLLVTNYYNPFQNLCSNTLQYIKTLNTHLANDVEGVGKIVDVFSAFGGATTPNQHLCTYTWICSQYQDIHPTDEGYKVIADAICFIRSTDGE